MSGRRTTLPSPPFRREREGTRREAVGRVRWVSAGRSGIPHLTPTLSAPSPHPSLPRKRGRVRVGALSAPGGGEGGWGA